LKGSSLPTMCWWMQYRVYVYPQYWETLDPKTTFLGHLAILKAKFCHTKENHHVVHWLSICWSSNIVWLTNYFFYIRMKSNSHVVLHLLPDCNLTIKLWGHLASNAIVVDKLSKYLKLVELTIVMVLGNVEDERTFSTFNFMRLKFHN